MQDFKLISNINNANKSLVSKQIQYHSVREVNRAMSKYLPLTPQCVLTCKVIEDIIIGTKHKLFITNCV